MPDVHALLSASAAKRWLNCPPSARLTENMPDSISEYAAEGTLAHELAELKLRKKFEVLPKSKYQTYAPQQAVPQPYTSQAAPVQQQYIPQYTQPAQQPYFDPLTGTYGG